MIIIFLLKQLLLPSHYKPGGGGRRKLCEIPTDVEGYSCRLLKAASNNGKSIIFIVPLQEEMSTAPLPYDSVEFSKMPQVPCVTCGTKMPLQMLALHADQCQQTTNVSSVFHVSFPLMSFCTCLIQQLSQETLAFSLSFFAYLPQNKFYTRQCYVFDCKSILNYI